MAASSRKPPEVLTVPSSLPTSSASTPSMPALEGEVEQRVAGTQEDDVNSWVENYC